eukprot:TRINITY_DN1411_c0_g1_i1.p3 TRINITY_DN1411_c0_g1~~TRINITY_DN1411_c0_g1_i1.p3  ORF type:complete len:430 (+),score=71.38 TRINITY_DN1411_c0_g1_i1:5400-6689(+)
MLATTRCYEIKYEIIKEKEKDIKVKGSIKDFVEHCTKILKTAVARFEEAVKYYSEEAREKPQKKLMEELLYKMEPSYRSLLESSSKEIIEQYKKGAAELIVKNGLTGFIPGSKAMKENMLRKFKKIAMKCNVDKEKWSYVFPLQDLTAILEELEKAFIKQAANEIISKESVISLYLNSQKQQTMENETHKYAKQQLAHLKCNFLEDLAKYYYQTISNAEQRVPHLLDKCLHMQIVNQEKKLEELLNNYYKAVKDLILKICTKLNQYALKKFSKEFYNHKNGSPRDWTTMDEEEINKLFRKCRNSALEFVRSFQKTRIAPYTNALAKVQEKEEILLTEKEVKQIADDLDKNIKDFLRDAKLKSVPFPLIEVFKHKQTRVSNSLKHILPFVLILIVILLYRPTWASFFHPWFYVVLILLYFSARRVTFSVL